MNKFKAKICNPSFGRIEKLFSSVTDPDQNPDPSDPYVFGPPGSGSGSISQRYGSGSGSDYHQAKKKKNLDSYCFVTSFWLFIFEKWCKCTFKSNKQTSFFKNKLLFVGILKVNDEKSRIRIRGSGSATLLFSKLRTLRQGKVNEWKFYENKSSSVTEPEWTRIHLGQWIQKTRQNFIFWGAGCPPWRAEGFFFPLLLPGSRGLEWPLRAPDGWGGPPLQAIAFLPHTPSEQ